MTRPGWTSSDIAAELHTDREAWALENMVDECGDPKPRFANWTPTEALARCRHIAQEHERCFEHGTGATK